MYIDLIEETLTSYSQSFKMGAYDDEGTRLSVGTFRYRNTSFGKDFIRAMTASGIATPVHYRRGGNVKKMFEYMYKKAYEDGIAVSVLHPFSFAYYNKFGYEKVADHLIVKLPIRYIDFVPRRCNLLPYTEDKLSDLITIYSEFSKGRNLLFERNAQEQFNFVPKSQTYVYYNNGKPEAYITYTTDKVLAVNHYENTIMRVHEMVYTSKESLSELFSFIRMFEGELDELEFTNLAMCPEVDLLLRNYTHTSYKLLPDISAKIINTETVLNSLTYPKKDGCFTLNVADGEIGTRGAFKVEFGGNDSCVTRLSDNVETDITLSSLALARVVYGYDALDALSLNYIDGISVNGNVDDFVLAFPKKRNGAFEHF